MSLTGAGRHLSGMNHPSAPRRVLASMILAFFLLPLTGLDQLAAQAHAAHLAASQVLPTDSSAPQPIIHSRGQGYEELFVASRLETASEMALLVTTPRQAGFEELQAFTLERPHAAAIAIPTLAIYTFSQRDFKQDMGLLLQGASQAQTTKLATLEAEGLNLADPVKTDHFRGCRGRGTIAMVGPDVHFAYAVAVAGASRSTISAGRPESAQHRSCKPYCATTAMLSRMAGQAIRATMKFCQEMSGMLCTGWYPAHGNDGVPVPITRLGLAVLGSGASPLAKKMLGALSTQLAGAPALHLERDAFGPAFDPSRYTITHPSHGPPAWGSKFFLPHLQPLLAFSDFDIPARVAFRSPAFSALVHALSLSAAMSVCGGLLPHNNYRINREVTS